MAMGLRGGGRDVSRWSGLTVPFFAVVPVISISMFPFGHGLSPPLGESVTIHAFVFVPDLGSSLYFAVEGANAAAAVAVLPAPAGLPMRPPVVVEVHTKYRVRLKNPLRGVVQCSTNGHDIAAASVLEEGRSRLGFALYTLHWNYTNVTPLPNHVRCIFVSDTPNFSDSLDSAPVIITAKPSL